MRTTVAIDDSLLAQAKRIALAEGRTLSDVVEDGLRRIVHQDSVARPSRPVSLRTHGRGGLRPGVDLANADQLAEMFGDNEPRGAAR